MPSRCDCGAETLDDAKTRPVYGLSLDLERLAAGGGPLAGAPLPPARGQLGS